MGRRVKQGTSGPHIRRRKRSLPELRPPGIESKMVLRALWRPYGALLSLMPFAFLFWMGWLFRSAVDGSVKHTRFRIVGLALCSFI